VQFVELETLLRESDYVSLHCPLLPETRHLIGKRALSLMKQGAILVNTARGPLVDSQALRTALEHGKLAAASLDVFEEEPLPKDSPLRTHPRVILSDHTAWYSEESQMQLRRMPPRKWCASVLADCRHRLPIRKFCIGSAAGMNGPRR